MRSSRENKTFVMRSNLNKLRGCLSPVTLWNPLIPWKTSTMCSSGPLNPNLAITFVLKSSAVNDDFKWISIEVPSS